MHPFSIDFITRGGEAYPQYDADCFRDSLSPGDSGLESSISSSPTSCASSTKQNDDCIAEVRKGVQHVRVLVGWGWGCFLEFWGSIFFFALCLMGGLNVYGGIRRPSVHNFKRLLL